MKRLRYLAVILAVLTVLSVLPISAANKAVLRTSNSDTDYVKFTIIGSTVKVEGKVICDDLAQLWLRSDKVNVANAHSKIINVKSGEYFCETLSLEGITEPRDITVYTYKDPGDGYFWSFIWKTVKIEACSGGYRFVTSDIEKHNAEKLSGWVNPAEALEMNSATVKSASDNICAGIEGDYNKVFALHKWVAENIYYDYDYYYGRSGNIAYDSEAVLETRRSVCEGYARLLCDLIRAQGIPAILTSTYAAGISVDDFASTASNATKSNHAHTEAFVDGRWITMDATWDSGNKYENGEFKTKAPDSFYYFDITPECFSYDHKIIRRQQSAPEDTPADWAKPEVSQALSNRLVPSSLQTDYADNITRRDFCILLMNMLCRAEGVDSVESLLAANGITETETPFNDVNDISVTAASKLGIVNGVTATRFSPNTSIKRQEAAAMIKRAASVLGVSGDTAGAAFSDTAESPSWAVEAIAFTSSLKSSSGARVMGGVGNGAFDPTGTFTRQQAILTVYRLFGC